MACDDGAMTARQIDPLVGVEWILVDGNNLLHAVGAERGSRERVPQAALIGRLRGAVPAAIAVEIVLDGPPDRGLAGRRIASGVTVRHAGGRTADAVIVGLVGGATRVAGGRPGILVVSDDRALGAQVRRLGATTAASTWLLRRLSRTRLTSPTVGRERPPAPAVEPTSEGDERPAWTPGRGATRKRGNPRRRPRSGPATMRP